MNLKFYTSVAKGLELKVRKFWGLIPTFVEVAGEKLVEEPPPPSPAPILNRVKLKNELTHRHSVGFCLGFTKYPGNIFTASVDCQ